MDYKKLVEVYERITGTSKRLAKTYHVSELIKNTADKDLEKVILLLNGSLYPAWNRKEIGVASRLVIKALSTATGISAKKVEKSWKNTGDLGGTAQKLVGKKMQSTLFSEGLTVEKVFSSLRKLAETSGQGSVDQKIKIISGLLSSASPVEAQYVVRTVLEDLRVGIGEGTIRDGIVWSSIEGLEIDYDEGENSFDYDIDDGLRKELPDSENYYNEIVEIVQSAYDKKNDFAEVVKITRKSGIKGLMEIEVDIGKPIKVMLFQKAKGIDDAFERVGRPAAFEYKYDGFRIQAHRKKGKIILFTRRLDDVTKQFPDVVKAIDENVEGDNFILDCEAVGYSKKSGKYLPFQSISQRIKRKYDIEKMARDYPVEVNVFDILAYKGEGMLKRPFKERREALDKIVKDKEKSIIKAKQIVTEDKKKAEKFYKEAIDAREEGVMAKNLEGVYKPGSRVGYGVKVKPVMENLDLVIIGAEWGKGKRKGWLSSFRIACQNDDGKLLGIGKVGTGIKELESESGVTFDYLTKILKPLVVKEEGAKVRVKPKVVIEVSYEEIQKSPTYESGYALRFPRVIQIREDKPVDEISSLDYVEGLYKGQR